MTERETVLYSNPHQVVIRQTADFLDHLQDSPWLVDQDSARKYIGNNSITFVRSAREHFPRLPYTPTQPEELIGTIDIGIKIPYNFRSSEEIILKGLNPVAPPEPLGLTIAILADMFKNKDQISVPKSPAETLEFLEEIESSLTGIAHGKIDPAESLDNIRYQKTKGFFTRGRRLPIKAIESVREKQQRINYEMNKLFGYTS